MRLVQSVSHLASDFQIGIANVYWRRATPCILGCRAVELSDQAASSSCYSFFKSTWLFAGISGRCMQGLGFLEEHKNICTQAGGSSHDALRKRPILGRYFGRKKVHDRVIARII